MNEATARGQVVDDFWLILHRWLGDSARCQGSCALFFSKILILVHNFTDFYLLECTSQLMLRCSTYTNVAMLKNEGWKTNTLSL